MTAPPPPPALLDNYVGGRFTPGPPRPTPLT